MSELWVGPTTAAPRPEPVRATTRNHKREGEPGREREQRPRHRTEEREAHAREAVGVERDRHLEDQSHAADEAEDREDPLVVEAERVADLREEDAEGGAVELVDRVEGEEDQQRVHRDRPPVTSFELPLHPAHW